MMCDPICPAPPVTRTLLPSSLNISLHSGESLGCVRAGDYFADGASDVLDIVLGHLWEQRQAQDAIRKPGGIRVAFEPVAKALHIVRVQVHRYEVNAAIDVFGFQHLHKAV